MTSATAANNGVLLMNTDGDRLYSLFVSFANEHIAVTVTGMSNRDYNDLARRRVKVILALGSERWGVNALPFGKSYRDGLIVWAMNVADEMPAMLGSVDKARVMIEDFPPIVFDLVEAWPLMIEAAVKVGKLVRQ